jgi:carbon monoxide dehydrogenase subunit G
MKITGEHHYDTPPGEVWEAILDPDVLSRTVPGCEDLKQTGEHEFSGKLKMKVGPVQGLFEGKVTLTDLDPPNGYRMKIEGRGAPGFMNGDGKLVLAADGAGTLLHYDIDAQVGGRIASVGQRLLESSAKVITRQGLEGLAVQLDARTAASASASPEAAAGAGDSTTGGPAGAGSEPRPAPATAPPPPSQAKFLGAVIAGLASELVPKERRPWVALGAVLIVLILAAVLLRTCG